MKFTLKENAIDSLNRSIRCFNENTDSGYKAAIKELVSSFELFLKEKIRQLDMNPESPVLVYDEFIVKLNGNNYLIEPKSKKKTITLEQSLERFDWLHYVISSFDKGTLKGIKKIRNTLEHYDVDINTVEVINAYISSLTYLILFLKKHLNIPHAEITEPSSFSEFLSKNSSFKTELTKNIKEIYSDIIRAEINISNTVVCKHCGCDIFIESSTKEYYESVICLTCGYIQKVEMCYNCKETFLIDDMHACEGDTLLCDKCFQENVV